MQFCNLLKALFRVLLVIVAASFIIAALNFPRAYDLPFSVAEIAAQKKHFEDNYAKNTAAKDRAKKGPQKLDDEEQRIADLVHDFIERYGLTDNALLDIGSGRGYLQDVVENYTGLDIASNAAPLYYKKFVAGSATAMPFADNTFDGAFSIWVFEHVPNPEQGFAETRRVIKNGGFLFLLPAWNVPSWYANGYPVRHFSELSVHEKIIKATLPIRTSLIYRVLTQLPVRILRSITVAMNGKTTFRYTKLEPNLKKYWMQDSDAINSIDPHEAMLWFTTHGDECLNCGSSPIFIPLDYEPLIFRINKKAH